MHHLRHWAHHPSQNATKDRPVPSRGYRKGISDNKRSRPHVVKARIATSAHKALHAEADDRSMTFSALVDRILDAHLAGHKLEAPHPRGLTSEAIRELARQGNNLNQIAHMANTMRLPHIAEQALTCIATINGAVQRLVS